MRSTLDLPDEIVEEAKRVTGLRTKREVVIRALSELVRRSRIEELRGMLGNTPLAITPEDLERLRGMELQEVPAQRRRTRTPPKASAKKAAE